MAGALPALRLPSCVLWRGHSCAAVRWRSPHEQGSEKAVLACPLGVPVGSRCVCTGAHSRHGQAVAGV